MEKDKEVLLYFSKYKFTGTNIEEEYKKLLSSNKEDDINNIKDQIDNIALEQIYNLINTKRETFISIFKKASKHLLPDDLFKIFNEYSVKYKYEIDEDDIDIICDMKNLHNFYNKCLENEKANSTDELLFRVLEMFTLTKESVSSYCNDDYFENDSFKLFLKDLSYIPLLTTEQTKELFKKYQQGEDVFDEIITGNLRLVINIAKYYVRKYQGYNVTIGELVDEGFLGLRTAILKFDVTKGYEFSTYAVRWIKQSISRYLDEKARIITIPAYRKKEMKYIDAAQTKLELEGNLDPTIEELSKETGYPVDKIEELRRVKQDVVSLDKKVRDESDSDPLSDFISDEEANGIYFADKSFEMDKVKDLYDAISLLDPKSQAVIKIRFGLENNEKLTLKEIGKIYGVSRERIRIIEENAKETLAILLSKYSGDYGVFPIFRDIVIDLDNKNNIKIDLHRRFEYFKRVVTRINDKGGFKILSFNPYEYTVKLECLECGSFTIVECQDIARPSFKCVNCKEKKKIKKYQTEINSINPKVKIISLGSRSNSSKFKCLDCGCEWDANLFYEISNPWCKICGKPKEFTRTRKDKNK